MDITIIILWIIATFIVGSVAGILGKKYTVAYPIALTASLIVIANIFAAKIIELGPFTVPAGVIAFSMTFFLTDILSERWGKREARHAVWAGFFANLLLIISIYFVTKWPPAPYATEISDMFEKVLTQTPRIIMASFITYLISQHHDVWAFHFWKKITKGKHLWFRNNASTITSQLIDSVLFITIAFYGIFPILPLILGQWAVKVIIAIADTPFLYATLYLMDKIKTQK